MSALKCKNCGGTIYLDDAQNLICDSCGATQRLSSAADSRIFDEGDVSPARINTYQRALELLSAADTEKSLTMVAELFESAGDLFNAALLAEECRGRATLLKQERYYKLAMNRMKSEDPEEIRKAIEIFEDLHNYKDAEAKAAESKRILEQAAVQYEKKRKKEEAAQQRAAAQKRRKRNLLLGLVAAVSIVLLLGNWLLHHPSNIQITVTPSRDNYVTQKYGDPVFNYDVRIKNNSPFDVTAIEASVYFEEADGNVLIDTSFNAGSTIYQSNPVVRGKKSSEYTWSVTVPSENKAATLYNYDFDELNVKIKIKKLRYGEGKVRSY